MKASSGEPIGQLAKGFTTPNETPTERSFHFGKETGEEEYNSLSSERIEAQAEEIPVAKPLS